MHAWGFTWPYICRGIMWGYLWPRIYPGIYEAHRALRGHDKREEYKREDTKVHRAVLIL